MREICFKERIGGFVHHLRENGHIVGIKELTDIVDSIANLEQPDENISRHYLRTICCRNKQEWQEFDDLFDKFWHPKTQNQSTNESSTTDTSSRRKAQEGVSGIAGTSTSHFDSLASNEHRGAGKQNTIAKADFRFLNDAHAMREAENLAEKLAIHLKSRTRTHKKISLKGKNMDVRHTLRKNLSHGGIPIQPAYAVKYKKPPHLVLLHDVSHSMSWNNPLLFRFARGLIHACSKSEAFVFHTKLFCVTEIYREKSIELMREKLESKNNLWLGGTCIAESIRQFNLNYAKAVLKNDSIIVIISDGFDTDEPEDLAKQLKLLNSRSKQILWLNPALGREPIKSNAHFIAAAQPYVDHFLPAHSVDALRDVIYKIKL